MQKINIGGLTWGINGGYDFFTRRNIIGFGVGYQGFNIEQSTANTISIKLGLYFANREQVED
jgi:hypothetical protein